MSTYLISVPDFSDGELLYSENETRLILKFFYPGQAAAIDGMTIDNEARRLAQTMLVGAVDGSYAIGFIEALVRSLARPHQKIRTLTLKLATRFAKHWYRHATQSDLKEARIYYPVRLSIANALQARFKELLDQKTGSLPGRHGGLTMHVLANPRLSPFSA